MDDNKLILTQFKSNEITPFQYLKIANEFLSNHKKESQGRDLIIRALADINKFKKYDFIVKDLVRKSGLFPYLYSEFENHSLEESFILDLYKSTHSENFIFHAMQFKIFNLLMHDKNVVLSAPTSMGKSAIIDALIASSKYKRMVIVVPTIALIDETRRRIFRQFNNDYEIIYHNSQTSKKDNVIYILTQERVNERSDIENVDLFIIDEFYKLAFKNENDERAISLNIALSKLISVSKQFYMIGPNIDHIRGINTFYTQYTFIPSSFNTVALNIEEYNLLPNETSRKDILLKEILTKNKQQQTIIYCKSPSSAADISQKLMEMDITNEYKSDYREWVESYYSKFWIYGKAIKHGIGIHHGALPRAIQQYTIDLFNNKSINILICTSTIIEGVNTNAENVIIYENRNGTNAIDYFTHNNIKGRAGRMKSHFIGNVYCLEEVPPKTVESRVVDIPLGVQSKETPYNFLAGIQTEHIDKKVKENFESFISSCKFPIELLKKHSTFKIDTLIEALSFVENLASYQKKLLFNRSLPKERTIKILCEFIRLVVSNSLSKVNLHFENSDLNVKFSKYLYAKSHQKYVDELIEWLESTDKNELEKSMIIDAELKIIRNIFGYSIPKALLLLSDILNYIEKEEKANFGQIISIFENNHLPHNFSALEEMGVPIQTLEKLISDKLDKKTVEVLVKYLLRYLDNFEHLNKMDRMFIKRALI